MPTAIEWTDEVWNPVTGCTEVSPGCNHCYAKTFAERFRGTPGHHFERGFDVMLRPDALDKPLRWKRPRRVFVNSMSDLFHRDVPDGFIAQIFGIMMRAKQHTFQVLTKRPERMRRFVSAIAAGKVEELRISRLGYDGLGSAFVQTTFPALSHKFDAPILASSFGGTWPPRNVWLGDSIESNEYAWRADMLRDTPAAMRFLSVEPMLGPVDQVNLEGVNWVICGGESGRQARPVDPAWVRDLRRRCVAAQIPFFFKQWGEWLPLNNETPQREGLGHRAIRYASGEIGQYVGKKIAGRVLDGRTWDEFPAAVL